MASSSTPSIHKRFKYDVFVSFIGEDIRNTFIDHLYTALQQQGIQPYMDDERIEKGNKINNELLKSIEDSKFLIIVFSKNYASSSRCLNELVKILEKTMIKDHIVYPVFYDVDPSEVRLQSGAFGEAFAIAKHNNEEAGKWRDALKAAADLTGLDLSNFADREEAKNIKSIVEQISLELRSRDTYIGTEIIVGMEGRVKQLLSSLETGIDDVRMIGIQGMGGAGKTTLARTVFNQISTQFEGKSFIENVRELSALSGLQSLQRRVLSDVLNGHHFIVSGVPDGQRKMKDMFRGRKVLIVLDDVDHIDQLKALAGQPNWFSPGSRIIITTRDQQVLVAHRVNLIFDVNLLTEEEALCLFSRYAFGINFPAQGYEMLSTQVVHYASGHPLMTRVLGAFLCGRDLNEWMDQVQKLKNTPPRAILDILESSYISLEADLKEMFLDIACFLKSSHKDDVVRILESCGFHAIIGLRVLEEKSLITISEGGYLGMHDLIQEMGMYIVRRLLDDPSRHTRLWIREEIEHILANELGTDETRAISVNSPVELCSVIVTKGFGSIKKLRLLRIVSEIDDDCDEKIGQLNLNFPNALQFLSWVGYPFGSLPKTFEANNLVALEMPYSRITQLWEGGKRKVLNKLRFLDLRQSQLRSLDLGMTPSLEKLDLEDCNNLVELNTTVGCLKRLVYLNLSGCSKIISLLFISELESLKVLCLTRLFLEQFPDIIPGHCHSSLLEFRFRHNLIEELPSSIGFLRELVCLDLHSCRKLRRLPKSICGLRHLRNLKLNGCILEELPEEIGQLECLEKLNLSFARIKHLPDSICMLKQLKTLNLTSCWNLEKLPEDLGCLECLQKLILTGCTQIKDIPDSICRLKSLKYLSLLNCIQVEKLPKGCELIECLEELNVKGTCIRHLPRSISLLAGLKIYGPK